MSVTDSANPVAVEGLANTISLSAGGDTTCAVRRDGAVQCWGFDNGDVGLGTSLFVSGPTTIAALPGIGSITAGRGRGCALRNDHTVQCWGVIATSTMSAFGSAPLTVPNLTDVTAVAANNDHACAITTGGTVKCWGYNALGELGDGTTANSPTPVVVNGISGAVAIAVGSFYSCALIGGAGLFAGGSIRCWGSNSIGQLGDGTTVDSSLPVHVAGITTATAIAAGEDHTCAVLASQAVVCWGNNASGQLGNGGTTSSSVAVVAGTIHASAVVAGTSHSCALLATGGVSCWGDNTYGQVGDTTTTRRTVPTAVALSGVTALSASGDNTCAAWGAANVSCWGHNDLGQIGDGTTTNATQPVAVASLGFGGLSGPTKVAVGASMACALRSVAVRCWGDNSQGQLGSGAALALAPRATTGLSALRTPTTVTTVPWSPAAPKAEAGSKKVTLTWTAPANGGSAITDYVVQFSSNGGTTWSTFNDGVHATTGATVTGLTNGHAYAFRVSAKNAKGTGAPSAKSTITPRTVPSAPAAPKAVAGTKRVTLTWTAPGNGGAAITDYVVQYSKNGGVTWSTFNDGVHATTGATVTGLVTGTTYVFRVAAKNAAGTGTYSLKSTNTKVK
jgi:alpha-tubulin suppressor-like RCC1 family protein